jgi:hypothetical protein
MNGGEWEGRNGGPGRIKGRRLLEMCLGGFAAAFGGEANGTQREQGEA